MPFTNTGQNITISGVETGGALRAYMTSNSLGVIRDRDITFLGDLIIPNDVTFTDENSLHQYAGSSRFLCRPNATVTYTNVIIKFNGGGRGFFSNMPASANLTLINCVYSVNTSGGRTDFFNPAERPLFGSLQNVQLIGDGNTFLHLYGSDSDPKTISEVTIDVDTGLAMENLTLKRCTFTDNMTNMFCDRGPNFFIDQRWDRDVWNIARGGSGFSTGKWVNPIKVSTWTGYTYVPFFGAVDPTSFQEVYTYEAIVQEPNGKLLQDVNIKLTNNTTTTDLFDLNTDISGVISQQEVQTHIGPSTYYNDFTIGFWKYGKNIRVEPRPFSSTPPIGSTGLYDGRIAETVNLLDDTQVTELNQEAVNAYTEIETSEKFYDRSHSFVVQNQLNQEIITKTGDTIDAGSYDVELRSGGSEVFAFDGTTISVRVGNTFIGNITTTGVVQENTTQVLGSITDSNSFRSNKVITLTGIANPSKVHLFNAGLTPTDLDYEIDTQLVTNGTYSFVFKAGQNITADVRVNSLQNRIIEFNVLLGLNDINIPISQQTDRIYENN